MKIFFDTEFTGLHKNTTLISIGLISEDGRTFYAEFNNYDKTQINEWIQEKVINNLKFKDENFCSKNYIDGITSLSEKWNVQMKGNKDEIAFILYEWFSQFTDIEMWSDCLAYDWVLFCDIFGSSFDIPKNIFYMPFDIATAFELKGIDPDIDREEYVSVNGDAKHNALHDAEVIMACYEKLMNGSESV